MMLTTLAYPRSGSTLIQFLLNYASPPIITDKLHGHDMINKDIDAFNDKELLVLIRNYKECIMSHLTRDDNQLDVSKIKKAFEQYIKVLEVYEASTCKKHLIYYEELITYPATTLQSAADYFGYNIKQVIEKLDYYLAASRQNYISKLGKTQTSGKETIHFTPLTQHYNFNWDKEISSLNPELYDKYLKIYGDDNE